jgi:hypothetical protein
MAYAYERMTEVVAKRDRMTGANDQQQQGGELSAAQRQFLDHRSRMGDDWSAPNRRQDYVAGHIEAVKAGWEIDSPQYFNVVKNYVERCGNGGVVLDEKGAARICESKYGSVSDQEYAQNAQKLAWLKQRGFYQD